MTADIIALSPNEPTPSDLTELRRWNAAAWHVGRYCVPGLFGIGDVIDHSDDGTASVAVTQGNPKNEALCQILLRRRRWAVTECPDGPVLGIYRTLREALESICPTPSMA